MASTTICDYQVMRDGSFTLDSGFNDVKTFTFKVPSDLHRNTSGSRKAIINFNLRPQVDSQVTVRLHTTNLMLTKVFSQSHTRHYQETFDIGSVLQTGVPEVGAQLLFNVPSGKVDFSDIVIWYQINR